MCVALPALEAGAIVTLSTRGNLVFFAIWLITASAILGGKWAVMIIRELPLEPGLVNLQPHGTIRESLKWLNGKAGTVLLVTEAWIGAFFGLWALLLFP